VPAVSDAIGPVSSSSPHAATNVATMMDAAVILIERDVTGEVCSRC
jgi:hypothetical protein